MAFARLATGPNVDVLLGALRLQSGQPVGLQGGGALMLQAAEYGQGSAATITSVTKGTTSLYAYPATTTIGKP